MCNRVKVKVYERDCDVAERTLERKLEERRHKSGTVPGEFNAGEVWVTPISSSINKGRMLDSAFSKGLLAFSFV